MFKDNSGIIILSLGQQGFVKLFEFLTNIFQKFLCTICPKKKTIKDNIPKMNNTKKFLESVGKKFMKFDKTENAYYLSLLTKTNYDDAIGIHEHAMKLGN